MNKTLIALVSAFTVFAANAATPAAPSPAAKPAEMAAPAAKPVEMAAPAAKTEAAPKMANVKKAKHAGKKKVVKHKADKAAAPKA